MNESNHQEEFSKKYSEVIAKAWSDEDFKKKLLENPNETLKEFGVPMPEGITFHIHENGSGTCHLILPKKPAGELSDEDLKKASGGMMQGSNSYGIEQGN